MAAEGMHEIEVERLKFRAGTITIESEYMTEGLLPIVLDGQPVLARSLKMFWHTKSHRWRILADLVGVPVEG